MLIKRLRSLKKNSVILCLFLSCPAQASLIESTIGAAVVKDATATYYNPAGLTLLKNPQAIPLGSTASFRTQFRGESIQSITGYTQSGRAGAKTHFVLPSFYFGLPVNKTVFLGMALIYNYFYRDIASDSILRYVQSDNRVAALDLVPAIGIRLNEKIAIGAGLSLSHIHFTTKPLAGFPTLGIPDIHTDNDSNGTSLGAHIGFLYQPNDATTIGFTYRNAMTYHLQGKSIFESNPPLVSHDFNSKFWTPARSVFSVNHFLTKNFGMISTVQYIQWCIFKDINIHNIATKIGSTSVILPNVKVRHHRHNSWIATIGSHYRIKPNWIVRGVVSYNESSANPHYQLASGDSLLLGVSTGYDVNKFFTFDLGYAHAFIKNQRIGIVAPRHTTNGLNHGYRDVASVKLTFNI